MPVAAQVAVESGSAVLPVKTHVFAGRLGIPLEDESLGCASIPLMQSGQFH
jgi:hypothetical protein